MVPISTTVTLYLQKCCLSATAEFLVLLFYAIFTLHICQSRMTLTWPPYIP